MENKQLKDMNDKLNKIIIEYELALQAYERALSEACYNENCGRSGKYLTDQEISEHIAVRLANNVRESAHNEDINLPEEKWEKFKLVERSSYIYE